MISSISTRAIALLALTLGSAMAAPTDPKDDPCAIVRCRDKTHCVAIDGKGVCVPDDNNDPDAVFTILPVTATVTASPVFTILPIKANAAGAVQCGRTTCGAGQVCCNASCGICTPPNGACTQQICESPAPAFAAAAAAPTDTNEDIEIGIPPMKCGPTFCTGGQECCNESCGLCVPPGGMCTQQVCSPTKCGNTECAAGLECCNESCGICVPPGGFCTQQFCGAA